MRALNVMNEIEATENKGTESKTTEAKTAEISPTDTAVLRDYLGSIAESCTVPLAVGFGIRRSQQVQQLRGYADIAIAGSAILDGYSAGGLAAVRTLIQELRSDG